MPYSSGDILLSVKVLRLALWYFFSNGGIVLSLPKKITVAQLDMMQNREGALWLCGLVWKYSGKCGQLFWYPRAELCWVFLTTHRGPTWNNIAAWDWLMKWDLPINLAKYNCLIIGLEVPLRWVWHPHPLIWVFRQTMYSLPLFSAPTLPDRIALPIFVRLTAWQLGCSLCTSCCVFVT